MATPEVHCPCVRSGHGRVRWENATNLLRELEQLGRIRA